MAFNVGALIASLKLDTKGFQAGVKQSTGQTKDLEKQALSLSKVLSKVLAAGALAAVAVAFKKTVDAAGDFEQSMANVSTLVDTAVIDVGKLSNAILDMTTDVLKSSEDLSAGLYQVFSAGVTNAAEALEVLRVSAIAATAGVADTASSVKAITGIMNAFGLSVESATDISDLLFQTVKLGVTTYGELAGAIGKVLSPAASLDIKLEELFAAIATLTKGTFSTAEAATALRATFISVLKPSDQALELAKELGLEWNATALTAKGLVKFLNDMKEATGGNVEQMAKLIPESTALNAALALAGKQAEEFNKITGEMENRLGSSQEAFGKQAAVYKAQEKALGLLIDRIIIDLGTEALPVLTEAVKMFGELIDIFRRLGVFVEPLSIVFNMVVSSIKAAALSGEIFYGNLLQILQGLGWMSDALGITSKAADFFGKKLQESFKSSEQLIASINTDFDEINTSLEKVFENIVAEIADTGKLVKAVADKAAEDVKTAGDKIATDSKKGAEEVAKSWKDIPDAIKEAFEKLGIIPKKQFESQVKEVVKNFELIAKSGELSNDDVIESRAKMFEDLQSLAEKAKEEGVLGIDIEDFKTRLDEVQQDLISKTTGATRILKDATGQNVTELFKEFQVNWTNASEVMLKGFTKDSAAIADEAAKGIGGLFEDTTQAQQDAFDKMTTEVERLAEFQFKTEEDVTKNLKVEIDERLQIIKDFVFAAEAEFIRLSAFQQGQRGGIPPVGSEAEDNFARGTNFVPRDMIAQLHRGEAVIPADQNTINQSVTINNARPSAEQGQDTIRAFNKMNASISF